MPDIFPFKQTAIATAIRSLRIYTRPPETAPEEKTKTCGANCRNTPEAIETMETSTHITASELTAPAPESEPLAGTSAARAKAVQTKAQASAVKNIGMRLREARELCNLSLSEAARRFGYANPSKLSKVELASDTNSIPLWLIVEASLIYEVSIDYLFGATDDWETGARMTQERHTSRWLFDKWEAARREDMAELIRLHNRLEAFHKVVSGIEQHASSITAAFSRFRELNPEFEDARGGANVEIGIAQLVEAARQARLTLTRFRAKIAAYPSRPADDAEVSL